MEGNSQVRDPELFQVPGQDRARLGQSHFRLPGGFCKNGAFVSTDYAQLLWNESPLVSSCPGECLPTATGVESNYSPAFGKSETQFVSERMAGETLTPRGQ